MRIGIIGLPNVGKSTLFNALTRAGAAAENYPFCTVDPNVGVVPVPDDRLDRMGALVKPETVIPATVEFVDIAGLVQGASKGEGLGNQFLGHVRDVEAVVHVVRCFADPDVIHVMGAVDPSRDHDVITAELALADLAVAERRLERVQKTARAGDKDAQAEAEFLERAIRELDAGRGVREVVDSELGARVTKQLGFLTGKPVLYAANIGENELPGEDLPAIDLLWDVVRTHHEEAEVVAFSAQFEAELLELEGPERAEFLASAGITEPGLNRLVAAAYRLLKLETFFTTGPKEVRAWTIRVGSTAYDAAGEIHSDFQRGFIRAETVHVEDFVGAGGYKGARDKGLVRSEGRDYRVRDGDVLLFRFNV